MPEFSATLLWEIQRMYSVYKHTLKSDGRVYIGISKNPKRRWANKGLFYEGCTHFYRAIQKYGWDSFDHEIIEEGLTKEEAESEEIRLIAEYRATEHDFGFNMAKGGNIYFPDQCIKVNRYTLDGKYIESFNSIQEAEQAVNTHGIGDACRRKNARANNSIWRFDSEEFPAGKDIDYFFTNNRVRAVNLYTLDGKYVKTYHSQREAGKDLGISQASIQEVCVERRNKKRVKEFRFKYLSEEFPAGKDLEEPYKDSRRKVNCYDLDGKYLMTFKTLADAGRHFEIHLNNIMGCCQFKKFSSAKHMFRYLSEEFPAGKDIESYEEIRAKNG